MTVTAARPVTFTYREITLQDRLREVAREVGGKPALVLGDRTLTYRELDERTDRLAGALARRGVKPGDRVTLFMPNSLEFVVAFYGALKAGGVVNPINALSKEREVRFQVADAGAAAVMYHEALAPIVDAVRAELGGVRTFAVTGASAPAGVERFDDLVAEPGTVSVRTAMSDLAALPYTSGTTGFPKGVMLTHANLTANQQQFFAAVPVSRDDVFLNVLPYFHIYALNLLMAGAVSLGATQVVMPRFDLVEYLTLAERHRATACFIVPPIVLGLAMHPEVDKHDLSSVRFFFSGAAPGEAPREADHPGLRSHRDLPGDARQSHGRADPRVDRSCDRGDRGPDRRPRDRDEDARDRRGRRDLRARTAGHARVLEQAGGHRRRHP